MWPILPRGGLLSLTGDRHAQGSALDCPAVQSFPPGMRPQWRELPGPTVRSWADAVLAPGLCCKAWAG